ncbi:MAG: GNAT family N-acetyltransferase [Bacteroidales bacterium]
MLHKMIDLNKLQIIPAEKTDAAVLTNIAFSAKRHWPYPESYFNTWQCELTITQDYIAAHTIYKIITDNTIAGFYSIVNNTKDFCSGEVFVQKGFWLEHIFIRPEYHHQGMGRLLIQHAKQIAKSKGIDALLIFVDPYARVFYDKIGADFLHESKSSIPERMIPVYRLKT